jgi:hypothetical protein
MGLKRKRFHCGWRTLWVLAVCMVEIGRVTVATGNASIEQKISAYPHKPTSAPLAADLRHPADLFR